MTLNRTYKKPKTGRKDRRKSRKYKKKTEHQNTKQPKTRQPIRTIKKIQTIRKEETKVRKTIQMRIPTIENTTQIMVRRKKNMIKTTKRQKLRRKQRQIRKLHKKQPTRNTIKRKPNRTWQNIEIHNKIIYRTNNQQNTYLNKIEKM